MRGHGPDRGLSESEYTLCGGGSGDDPTRATLVVLPEPGVYTTPGRTYDVVTGSSVSGDFDIEQTLFFFDILGGVAGNAYRLTLLPNSNTLESVATTPNQHVTGRSSICFASRHRAAIPRSSPINRP